MTERKNILGIIPARKSSKRIPRKNIRFLNNKPLIEYSFESDSRIKLNFNIEVETYQPVFDPTTEMDANNYMRGIGYRIYEHDEKNDGTITITGPDPSTTIPKDSPIMFEWTYKDEGGIIDKVDLYWTEAGESDRNTIKKGAQNHEYWIWDIPNTFTSFILISLTLSRALVYALKANPAILSTLSSMALNSS